MADFWSENAYQSQSPGLKPGQTILGQTGPSQDFNLGGYQPQTPNPYENDFTPRNPDGSLVTGPLVGPDPRVTTQPQPYQQGPQDSQVGMGSLGQIGQHGGFGGLIAGAVGEPQFQQMLQQYRGQQGGGFWGPLRGAVQSMARPSFGQTLMNAGGQPQGNGVPTGWAPASQAGPMFQQGQPQPMNPSQQSGQVGMMSPDGNHFQYVNAEHVPHYQGLGAQVVNGSSYGQ